MDLSAYEATLSHLELITQKRLRLDMAQIDAERQVLHRIGRDFEAGRISERDLVQLYARYRKIRMNDSPGMPAFTRMWRETIPVNPARMQHGIVHDPEPDGTWAGEYPLADDARPPDGQSVVYVLFDPENAPCYVGSSEQFATRLRAHEKGGKRFARWIAYPCADRGAAYALEDRLLKEHKPYLNRRAAR